MSEALDAATRVLAEVSAEIDALQARLKTLRRQVNGIEMERDAAIGEIIREVAAKHGITAPQLTGRQRSRRYSWPRHEAIWRCTQDTRASLSEIARHFSGLDHTSVMYARDAHQARIEKKLRIQRLGGRVPVILSRPQDAVVTKAEKCISF